MQEYRNRFFEKLVAQDIAGSMEVIDAALGARLPANHILAQVVTSAMERIGQMQTDQQVTLSEVFVIASISDMAIDRLLSVMPERPLSLGTVVLGTIQGDYHSLGRKIVGSFLRLASYRVIDLGASVAPERFVETAVTEHAFAICVSALLLHTAENIKKIRCLLDERGLNRRIKLVVGGAAFSLDRELARTVGADSTAINAYGATACLRNLAWRAGV